MSKEKEAKETKDEGKSEPKDPATVAKELEGKLKLNKILLIVAISLFTLTLCVLGAGFGVIYIKVAAVSDAPTDKIDEQLAKINQELESLKTFREDEITSIEAFDAKIRDLQGEHESIDSATMKQVFLDREKDYQHLVDTLRAGTESLAGMVAGSRDWVDFYKGEMEAIKKHSVRRSAAIESTMSDERTEKPGTTAAQDPAKPTPKEH